MPKAQTQVWMRQTASASADTCTTADETSSRSTDEGTSANPTPSRSAHGAATNCQASYTPATDAETVHTEMREVLQQTNQGLWV